jgi:hypothetical protein
VEGEVVKISRSTGIITLKTRITKENNIELVTGEAKVVVLEPNHDS